MVQIRQWKWWEDSASKGQHDLPEEGNAFVRVNSSDQKNIKILVENQKVLKPQVKIGEITNIEVFVQGEQERSENLKPQPLLSLSKTM